MSTLNNFRSSQLIRSKNVCPNMIKVGHQAFWFVSSHKRMMTRTFLVLWNSDYRIDSSKDFQVPTDFLHTMFVYVFLNLLSFLEDLPDHKAGPQQKVEGECSALCAGFLSLCRCCRQAWAFGLGWDGLVTNEEPGGRHWRGVA